MTSRTQLLNLIIMGLLTGLINGAKKLGESVKNAVKKLVQGVATVVDLTLEACQSVAEAVADGIQWVRDKIEEWTPKEPPADPIMNDAKQANTPLIKPVGDKINENFPSGIRETAVNTTADTRIKEIAELVPTLATTMGIEEVPEVVFFTPESEELKHTSCGAYNWTNNQLKINAAMIVCDDAPELFEEQVYTVAHELIHARQVAAVRDWANGKSVDKYGYTTEYVEILAYNFLNYITYGEDPEGYCKQPLEAEAFWFESQIKEFINNKK